MVHAPEVTTVHMVLATHVSAQLASTRMRLDRHPAKTVIERNTVHSRPSQPLVSPAPMDSTALVDRYLHNHTISPLVVSAPKDITVSLVTSTTAQTVDTPQLRVCPSVTLAHQASTVTIQMVLSLLLSVQLATSAQSKLVTLTNAPTVLTPRPIKLVLRLLINVLHAHLVTTVTMVHSTERTSASKATTATLVLTNMTRKVSNAQPATTAQMEPSCQLPAQTVNTRCEVPRLKTIAQIVEKVSIV